MRLGRQLRAVPVVVDHAEEAHRFAIRGTELMPDPGRDGDQIMRLHLAHGIAKQALSVAAQDHHRVHMLMAFQGGMAAGIHLEIP